MKRGDEKDISFLIIFVVFFIIFNIFLIRAVNLPTVGGDADNWGSILNNFLLKEHNSDGTHGNITASNLRINGILNTSGDIYFNNGTSVSGGIFSLNSTTNIMNLGFYNKSEADKNLSFYYLSSNPSGFINTSSNANFSNFSAISYNWGANGQNLNDTNRTQFVASSGFLSIIENWLYGTPFTNAWNLLFRNYFNQDLNITSNPSFNSANLTSGYIWMNGDRYSASDLNATGTSAGIGNPFDQVLNTTSNVTFYGINITGNYIWNGSNRFSFADLNASIGIGGMNYTNLALINITNNFNSPQNFSSINTTILYVNGTQITGGSGVPSGAIMAFNSASCPTGWVLADGTSGTPDLRGIFIRGSGTSGVLKWANGTYINAGIGTYQNDSFQGHNHSGTFFPVGGVNVFDITAGAISTLHAGAKVGNPTSDGRNGEPRTGAETSPASYATIYCVKTAEDTPVSNTIWGTSGNNTFVQNTSLNVGIGTTTPSQKLEVAGNVNVTGTTTSGTYNTFTGSQAGATHLTYYTAFTASGTSGQMWIVSSYILGSDSPNNYHLVDIVTVANNIMVVTHLKTATAMDSQASGLNFQIRQGSGVSQTLQWVAVKIG